MKQTNNAIKFLMAQYRAIFKNANIAMVAAIAAAALAAGQAQAAEIQLGTSADKAVESIVVSGSDTGPKAGGFVKNLTIKNGGTLTFDGSATANTGHIKVSNLLSVESGGNIIVKGHTASTNGTGFMGTFVDGDDFSNANSELRVNGGSIEVTKSQIQMNNVNLNNATVTIGTNLGDKNKSDFDDNAQINAVSSDTGGGLFTVTGDKSNITLQSGSILNAAVYDFKKGDINLSGNAASGEYAVIRAFGKGIVNVDGANINASTSGNYIGGKEINVKSGNINVKANGVLHLTGKLDKSKNMDAAQADTTISVTGGKINVAKTGLLTIKGNATFASGTVVNSGTIEAVAGSKIKANGNEGLYSKEGQLKLTGATLNFTGASLDLSDSGSNISGDADSLIFAEKGSVTIAKDFEKKAGNVTAGTIVVSGVAKGQPGASDGALDGSYSLVAGGGAHITALTELKGSKEKSILMLNPATSTNASLTLGNGTDSKGKLTNMARVQIGKADTEGTSKFDVHGTWDFQNAGLYVAKGATATINAGAQITNVERLKVEDGSTTNIHGTANINRLQAEASKGDGQVNVYGTLNIRGDGQKDGPNASQKYSNDVYLKKGKLNINAGGTVALTTKDAWDDVLSFSTDSSTGISTFTVSTSGDNSADNGAWAKESVTLNAGGTLRIDLSGYKVADKTAVENLAKALIKGGSNGLVDLGGIELGTLTTQDNGSINLTDMPTVKTEDTKDLEVNLGSTTTLQNSYSMGSANVSGNNLTIGTGSTVEFNKAKNGQFANNIADAGSKVNVTLAANSAVNLNGNGSLGDIKKSGSDAGTVAVLGGKNGTQTVGVVDVATFNQLGGNVTTGAITATDISVKGVLKAGGDVTTTTLNIDGGAINAAGKDITVSGSTEAKIFGDVEASSLSLSGGALIAGGADVKLDSLKGATDTTIQVGEDREGGLGATVTTTNLVLNGGSIFVDPEFGTTAGFVVTENLSNAGSTTSGSGTLDGKAYVGKNAALGIGFAKTDAGLAELKALVAPYLVDNGGFAEKGVKNALVINDSVNVASGNGFVVDHELTSANYKNNKPENKIVLGAGSALVVTDKALDDGAKAAITFANTTASLTAGDGAKVVLVGDFTAADKGQKIFAADNGNADVTGTVYVVAAGGLLVGEINNGSIASLNLDPDAEKAIRSEVSAPVGQLFVDFANGKFDGSTGAGYDFLTKAISNKQFKAIDAAAHAATYAGAQQAAVVSVTTMADAMFGRVGAVGVEAASIAATGSQANGGVWLTPMYKSMDADGFNAEGVSYGSDVDAAGVAFGADTVNGNMRFGAVFNIGSGDSEGKGQGNGLKDEFDYYGFGIYSAMGFGNFALVGDASLTVVSHEVEGLGLKGKADTTAVTMGITGQYTVATEAVDVTPHLGARFIRLNTDSYDLVGADGAIATTDFDVQNVFSVPLGVTLSKGFVTGGWTLAPSADLTVAFNTGDTEAKSTTTFSGIAHGINMNTEVLDEVQYGVTLGLGAQYGAFGTSFGINYTGSSNTDSFGVNAQARYMF